jgi:hypothetical protein
MPGRPNPVLTYCAVVATTCWRLNLACQWIYKMATMIKPEPALNRVKQKGGVSPKDLAPPGIVHRS